MPRFAFPVYCVGALAPVVGCTVLTALAITGVMSPIPALAFGLSMFLVTVLGTAVAKYLEDWESRP